MKKKDTKGDFFKYKYLDSSKKKDCVDIDLNALYERADDELALQQSKRDQIITLYLAIFSFLIPFALSMQDINWQVKGFIFLATAIVGALFALVIIRYRIYKEVYWLCCQSITVLFGIRYECMDKETIQSIFYNCLQKRGKEYMVEDKNNKKVFSKFVYIKKNLFSSETIYFFIHLFITCLIFSLSVALILKFNTVWNILISILCGIIVFTLFSAKYFSECIKVYGVLIDDMEKSFNSTFKKAWFLHFYL